MKTFEDLKECLTSAIKDNNIRLSCISKLEQLNNLDLSLLDRVMLKAITVNAILDAVRQVGEGNRRVAKFYINLIESGKIGDEFNKERVMEIILNFANKSYGARGQLKATLEKLAPINIWESVMSELAELQEESVRSNFS